MGKRRNKFERTFAGILARNRLKGFKKTKFLIYKKA